mgnify:CR=1 FL=1
MRSEIEIENKLNLLKDYLKFGYFMVPPPQKDNKKMMEGWVDALKWVLETQIDE